MSRNQKQKIIFSLFLLCSTYTTMAQSWWGKLFGSDDPKSKFHYSIENNQFTTDFDKWKNEKEFNSNQNVLHPNVSSFEKIKLIGNTIDNFIEHLYVNKNLMVIHPAYSNIFLYEKNGKFRKELTRKGRGPGEIEDLADPVFSIFRDTIYVVSNGSISQFSPDGFDLRRQYIGSFARSFPIMNKDYIVTNNFAVDPKNTYTIYVYAKNNYQHLYSIRFNKSDMMNIQPMSSKTDVSLTFESNNQMIFHPKNTSFFYEFNVAIRSITNAYNIKHAYYKEPEKKDTKYNSIGDLMWYNRNYFSAYFSIRDDNRLIIFYSKDNTQEGVVATTSALVVVADLQKKEILRQYLFTGYHPLFYFDKKIYLRYNNFDKMNDDEMNTLYLLPIITEK